MPNGLYMPDGSFKEFNAQDLTTEIATRANAGGLFDGSYGSFLCLLPDPDPVLRSRGDEAAILEDLAADGHVTAAMIGRKERVLMRDDYAINPGAKEGEEPTDRAKLLATQLTSDLERTSLHDIVSQILDAPFYGMVPLEILWEPNGNWWHIKDIIPRPYSWFAYNNKNQLVFKGANYFSAEPVSHGKFVVARHHHTYKNPYGLRLLSRCLWPIAFKRGGTQFYVRFVEKFGIPHTIGEAPVKATAADKRQMAIDLANIVSNAVAVIPHGAKVAFETVTGNTGDVHEKFLSRWDKELSKILGGQTLTLEMEGSNSLAASETHAGVAEDLSHADRRIVTSTMNEICWLYAQVNASKGEFCPVFGYKDIEDLHGRVKLDKELYSIGVRFKPAHFIDVYKLKEDEFSLSSGQPEMGSVDAESTSFSASAKKAGQPIFTAEHNLEQVIKDALPEVIKGNADFVTQLENIVENSSSHEDLEFALAGLLGDSTEPDELEDILARAMTAAASYGANVAKQEEPSDV